MCMTIGNGLACHGKQCYVYRKLKQQTATMSSNRTQQTFMWV